MIADFLAEIFIGLIYGSGALIYWLLKGCKTKFKDEIENYKLRNTITSIVIVALIVGIFIKIQN